MLRNLALSLAALCAALSPAAFAGDARPPTLRQAAEVLLTQKYGCLPVVECGKLVGIITASDFIRLSLDLMDALEASEKFEDEDGEPEGPEK